MINTNLALVRNIKIRCSHEQPCVLDGEAVKRAVKIIKRNRIKADTSKAFVFKKSIDARCRDDIYLIYTIAFPTECNDSIKGKEIDFLYSFDYDKLFETSKKTSARPVVVGFGPSGMFCALALSKAGLRPIVIERGGDVDERTMAVNKYWKEGVLDESTNVQFGEGGAGTFSDGKLLTRISDRLCSYVLHELVRHGAPSEIVYLAKPHIGTDNLKNVVKSIRKEITGLGGQVRFNTRLDGVVCNDAGQVSSILLSDGTSIECDALFLCIGHSARDTVKKLMSGGVTVLPKPFSVGVRIEHLQSDIDNALYGAFAGNVNLGAASYTLSRKFDNRAVYSFCMCPGGTVVASASEKGEIVTNGMSEYSRSGKNANSAIAVSVDLADFGGSVDGAIDFQRNIERAAFKIGGGDGTAPIQLLGDFLQSRAINEPSRILPTYTGNVKVARADDVFPSFVTDNLRKGISMFERDISGFSCSDAVLTFPETRTSSPFRIQREKNYLASGFCNLYPCGEGAGYAGGITSAAVDGMRSAIEYLNS